QTFPEDIIFAGPRSAQYHQVGDAVPPQLATAIGKALGAQLLAGDDGTAEDDEDIGPLFSSRVQGRCRA
ncbi:MAG: DNA cytosine methyltransferase, partial [Planctomycetes bacterium]|nr:DNA cytosine methyltransferase [Planctomycetota bacterium]